MNAHTTQVNDVGGLSTHLDRIRQLPRLTRAQEHALAVRAQQGDAAAKQALVQHNLWLVVTVTRKLRLGGLRLEDLIQEGSLGLMRAAESYDPRAGTRFSTYAVWWIRAFVGKYLQSARSSVRPRRGTVAQLDVSLDATVGEEDGPSRLESVADDVPTPEDAYRRAENQRDVRVAVRDARGGVSELGWDIVHNRLAQDPPETLEQIARRWGLSRERVRQVEMATRKVLRRHLEPVHAREAA